MNYYEFPKTKGYRCLFALLLTALLFLSRDTLLTLNLVGFERGQLISAGLILAAGVFFLVSNRKKLPEILKDPRVLLAVLAVVVLMVPMLIKRDFQLMYFSILYYILACILLSYFIHVKTASRYYVVILSLLGIYSVICTYFLRILPDRGIWNVPVFANSMGFEFYNFGLAQVSIEYVKNRNFGIFREPGVYQFFLLLGLYLNNYRADWEKNWQIWTVNVLLALTMLSTFATGGVIEMGLLAVFLFFDKKWYKKPLARLIAALLILAAVGGAAWILLTKNSFYVEFVGMITKFSSEESGSSRFAAIATDAEIFFRHPLVGDSFSNVLHVVESNATSTMVLYAALGIFGGLFHTLSWAALSWDGEKGIFRNLLLLLILFMSFNTQNLSWNLIFWLFPMLAMAERGIPAFRQLTVKRSSHSA